MSDIAPIHSIQYHVANEIRWSGLAGRPPNMVFYTGNGNGSGAGTPSAAPSSNPLSCFD